MLFAAKEACAKALGTGFADGVELRAIDVELPDRLQLTAGARSRLDRLAGDADEPKLFLDVFCRGPLAGAIVIIAATCA